MRLGRSVVIAAGLFLSACSTSKLGPGASIPLGGLAGEMSGNTFVRLTYTRPTRSPSPQRPDGFEVIADYKSSDEIAHYDGIWNDSNQTLTDQVPFPVGSVNLVFVIDKAIEPGNGTPITASHEGRMREVPCPTIVRDIVACFELVVTRGH